VGKLPADFAAGVYCGWASVNNGHAYKMVMSIGWNPQYQNQQKSMETHIMHKFEDDFYGAELKVCVVHYIRGEKKFDTLNQLILEIQNDISFAESNLSVNDAAYQQFLTYINT
jgi:riboflavin kinase